jgi:hypothetical protein
MQSGLKDRSRPPGYLRLGEVQYAHVQLQGYQSVNDSVSASMIGLDLFSVESVSRSST